MQDSAFGTIKINLTQRIQLAGISKNKLAHRAQMERTQLNNYCKGTIQRVDLAILSRLCFVLDCSIADILEYIPPDPLVE